MNKSREEPLFAPPAAAAKESAAAPAALSPRPWTPDQLRGITTSGRSLLVSAAAGSGKTAVLSERCAYLVCDAPEPCDVDELLVVTFTDAAAVEMKSRIAAALSDRARRSPSPRIARQLALVEQANVSTLHSFCMRMLRQHFHVAGMDPAFRVLDADEAALLRRETARELLRHRYELDDTGEFQRLIDAFGEADDNRILRQLLHTHDLLTSVVQPQDWLQNARRRITEAAAGNLADSELGRELDALIRCGLDSLRQRCAAVRRQVADLGFAKYAEYAAGLDAIVRYWTDALADGGVDALCEVVKDVQWQTLPREGGDAADRDVAKEAVESVRKQMKEGPWRDILRFSSGQWQEGLALMRPYAEVFLSLVEQFEGRYRMAKSASRAVDFADLERQALAVLRDPHAPGLEPSAVARAYHRRFAHVLVDEYQDINQVQDAILHLVSRECVGKQPRVVPNLFCVGDVKQSIYRFRLAEPARFLARQAALRAEGSRGEVIDLQHNFRSRGPLLDAINTIFERLMTAEAAEIAYDQTHRLRAGLAFPASEGVCCFTGSPIELHLLSANAPETDDDADEGESADLDRTEREAVLIARRIRQIVGLDGNPPTCIMRRGKNGLEPHPARFSDVVVLLRAMKHKSGQIAAVLRASGIPVHTDSGAGYFQSVEVRDMLALLSLLDNRRQDIPLATVLRSPLAGLPDPEDSMARIRIAYPQADDPVPFHQAVVRYAAEQQDDLAIHLRDFLAQLDRWRQAARRRPLAEAIWRIYRETGYLAYIGGLANGEQRTANLMHLHERAARFGTFQGQGLSRFLRFLHDLEEESDAGLPSIASDAEDVVRIMSVHRSKGLEFPIVILPDLGKAMNLSDCHGHILVDRLGGLGMSVVDEPRRCRYPSLALTLVRERLRRQTLAEELRVLYVALTRAKEHLILIGTCADTACGKWTSRWKNHQGPLPAEVVLGARTMLDWLGPVASAANDAFVTTTYSAQDVRTWESTAAASSAFSPRQEELARLLPLPADPDVPQAAARVIARVSFEYAHKSFSALPAVRAVTAQDSASNTVANCLAQLPRPRFMLEEAAPSATERGAATHIVLQHFNFAGPCDPADVAAQIDSLISRRALAPAQAAQVDQESILWFLATPTGRLLRQHHSILRRELPIQFPQSADLMDDSAACPEPLDRVMVRGRIDVLIPLPGKSVLLDYKTDAISPEQVPGRAEWYAPQLDAYRRAIERITTMPVAKALLVFLAPRIVHEA